MRVLTIAFTFPFAIVGCCAINAYTMAANSMSTQKQYTHYCWWKPDAAGA
ncbi:MAG: hypothetical protein ABIW82_03990 [Dokdonella sp.]